MFFSKRNFTAARTKEKEQLPPQQRTTPTCGPIELSVSSKTHCDVSNRTGPTTPPVICRSSHMASVCWVYRRKLRRLKLTSRKRKLKVKLEEKLKVKLEEKKKTSTLKEEKQREIMPG